MTKPKIRHAITPRQRARRAANLAQWFEAGAVYTLPSKRLARYVGCREDALEFVLVDAHRATDIAHGELTLSAAVAQAATLAYGADAWQRRRMQHDMRTRLQGRSPCADH